MKLADVLGVLSFLAGGGILARLLGRYTAEPGPILALSRANMTEVQGDPNRVYPRIVEIENIGNRPALETVWEIRHYYPTFPPEYSGMYGNRLIAVKAGESFRCSIGQQGLEHEPDVPGHHGLSPQHFGCYEILLWYKSPNRVKYLSHLSIWLGDLRQHQVGLNPLQRAISFLRFRIWMKHFRAVARIRLKLWLRPRLYKVLHGRDG